MTSNYTLEVLQDPASLIFTVDETFDPFTDHPHSTQQILEILDQRTSPLVYIADLRWLHYNFEEAIEMANRVSRGRTSTYHHPMIKKVCVVTTDESLIATFHGLDHPIFGSVKVHLYSTLEEAVADANNA